MAMPSPMTLEKLGNLPATVLLFLLLGAMMWGAWVLGNRIVDELDESVKATAVSSNAHARFLERLAVVHEERLEIEREADRKLGLLIDRCFQ